MQDTKNIQQLDKSQNNLNTNYNLKILDIQGRIIKNMNIFETTISIDVEGIEQGICFYEIKRKINESIERGQIIKQ